MSILSARIMKFLLGERTSDVRILESLNLYERSAFALCRTRPTASLHPLSACVKIFNAVIITTLLYASECWTLLATDLTKLEVFQMSCLHQILGVTWRDRLRNDTIRHRCKKQPTVEKRIQWHTCDGLAMCVAWTTPVCQNSSVLLFCSARSEHDVCVNIGIN